ncbi:hypothetical protein PCE1_002924 [Barthelona sp. PCE]
MVELTSLDQISTLKPGTRQIIIENVDLDDSQLSNIFAQLEQFKHLEWLSIASNRVTTLDIDMSAFKSLVYFDFSSNPITEVPLQTLTTISNLRHVVTSYLSEESEENMAMELENLLSLNGLPLVAAEKANQDVRQLLLSLSSTPVAELDDVELEEKIEADIKEVVEETVMPVEEEPEAEVEEPFTVVDRISVDEIEEIANVFDAIKSIFVKTPEDDLFLTNRFEKKTGTIFKRLESKLNTISEEEAEKRSVEIHNAKFNLFDLCLKEFISIESANVVTDVEMQKVNILNVIRESMNECFRSVVPVIDIVQERHENKIITLKRERKELQNEVSRVLSVAENLQNDNEQMFNVQKDSKNRYDHDKMELLNKVGDLQAENERLKARVQQLKLQQLKSQKGTQGFLQTMKSRIRPPSPQLNTTAIPSSVPKYMQGKNETPKKDTPKRTFLRTDEAPASATTKKRSRSYKQLTLKQTKDLINDVYTSKIAHDKKCKEVGLPVETLEQHIITYFNQRYGLKRLVQEMLHSFSRATKKFALEDNYILVFLRILKHQIDEHFVSVQKQLVETVNSLVDVYLRNKYPNMPIKAVKKKAQEVTADYINESMYVDIITYIYEEADAMEVLQLVQSHTKKEWTRRLAEGDIIDDLVNYDGGLSAAERLRFKQLSKSGKLNNHVAELSLLPQKEKTKIRFNDFIQILLNFQLNGHIAYLKTFQDIFNTFDGDGNGQLNDEEFKMLMRKVIHGLSELQCTTYLNDADPLGSNSFTFTQCVEFFSDKISFTDIRV